MLTNKKTSIRLLALVMALFMTVAVFVGCSDNSAAQAEIDAAKAAAAAAQAAADAAQKQAAEIQAQLEAAQKAAADAQAAADAAQKEIDSIHDGAVTEAPKAPDAIEKDPYDAATNFVTESILAEFSALKVQYLNIQQNWYTDANYIKLAKIFDDASVALYRATTKEGVENVLTKLSADAAAIANIYTDAEAVQALIVALGNVDTDVTLNSADKVTAAENAYLNWVEDYAKYFAAQGLNVANYEKNEVVADAVDEIAEEEFAIAVPTIAYAQNKILLLTALAETVSETAFWAVAFDDWGDTRYEDMDNIEEIVAAYELYKTFVVLNGGDESPIKHSEYVSGVRYTLTGEEFVKEYVNVIFTAFLQQYQTAVKTFINGMPAFFMESGAAGKVELQYYLEADLTGLDMAYLGTYDYAVFGANYELDDILGSEYDGQAAKVDETKWATKLDIYDAEGNSEKFRNELETIATVYNAEILKLDYLKDFKGKLSLEDAFRQIDAFAEKAIVEMAQSYYTQVAVAYESNKINDKVAAIVAGYNADLAAVADPALAAALKSYVAAFNADAKKIIADADAYMAGVKIPTYDELNSRWNSNKALYNIDNLDLFVLNDYVADGYVEVKLNVANATLSPMHLILSGVKTTNATMYKKLGDSYYNQLAKEIEFFDFKWTLAEGLYALNQALITVDSDGDDASSELTVDKNGTVDAIEIINGILGDAEATKLLANGDAWKNYVAAQNALLAETVKAVMDVDYDSFKSSTANAQYLNSSKQAKQIYYKTSGLTLTTSSSSAAALTIVTDKMINAKDAAVKAFAAGADKYYTNFVDTFRASINADFDKAIAAYNNNYADDKDSVNLMTDINAYVAYLKTLTTGTSVTGFDVADFSLNGDTILYKNSVPGDTVKVAAGKLGFTADEAGKVLHVTEYTDADDIVEAYAAAFDADVKELASLVGDDDAYKKLERVRLLAYYKDDAMVKVDEILADYKGTWDAKTNTWAEAPVLAYDLKSARTAKYLAELDATAALVKDYIKNITLLSENADGAKINYAAAIAWVDDIVEAAETETSYADADYKWVHDLSFETTYDRYYRTNTDGTSFYDWNWYYNAD